MQPGCGAAHPTMIRGNPSIKLASPARGKLKALSRGGHPSRLLSYFNQIMHKRTGIRELSSLIPVYLRQFDFSECTGTAVPCLGTSLRK